MKKILTACFLTSVVLLSCSPYDGGSYFSGEMDESARPDYNGVDGAAGVLTAGEWCDLLHWDFWGMLMTASAPEDDAEQSSPDYGKMAAEWGFNTLHRVAVRIHSTDGTPLANAKVELLKNGVPVWESRTGNEGQAQLWQDLFSPRGQETGTEGLQIRIEGILQDGAVKVCTYTEAVENEYVFDADDTAEAKADIAFIVDATGSMGDEIRFLKEDLLSILEKVQQSQSRISIRTGAVFYRDQGDDYLTRSDDFQTPDKTMAFIGKQTANGGGDTPEAVHSALEAALRDLSWNTQARARVAFLILDAPAHRNHDGVLNSLQNSIRQFSRMGIRMIPVLASTGEKTTEFMCRDFAIATGGTYVFLTDDSGVGESHITPSVGEYEVEKLNDLLYRLIESYIR